MSRQARFLFLLLMSMALFFGFLEHFTPGTFPFTFERLHIFLFNLCTGGTIVLYHTEGRAGFSGKVILFGVLATVYAVLAFFQIYAPAMAISLFLAAIVESVRIRRFSVFPKDFFRSSVPIAEKFNQASLLCLSIGLTISSMVILNNEYLHLPMFSFRKLTLNTFFLGFSFPVSLITFSVIFDLMKNETDGSYACLKEYGFWAVNLGVIIFFLFILFEMLIAQLFVTLILLGTVVMIFLLYIRLGIRAQQKNFLSSGIGFLLFTAVTGILYIVMEFFPEYYTTENSRFLLSLHSFASLYGWNLSGLAIICRFHDFPLKLHSRGIIIFHWIIVILLAPLGKYSLPFAVLAVISYIAMLFVIFFNKGNGQALDRSPAAAVATGNRA
ncbi:MAG: hypothetical protein ACOZF0_21495 [Thermodesulfobacteriota bacterium]